MENAGEEIAEALSAELRTEDPITLPVASTLPIIEMGDTMALVRGS